MDPVAAFLGFLGIWLILTEGILPDLTLISTPDTSAPMVPVTSPNEGTDHED